MTAIAAVSTPWGVLMAADGRLRVNGPVEALEKDFPRKDFLSKHSECAQKIFAIVDPGRTIIFAVAGTAACDTTEGTIFDIREEIQRSAAALSDQSFADPLVYLTSLLRPVVAEIETIGHLPTCNDKSSSGGWKIVDVILGGCFGQQICFSQVEISHSNAKVTANTISYLIDNSGKLCYGSEKVFDAMYKQDGAPIPYSLLAKHGYQFNGTPSVTEARRFAVGYIEACCSVEGRALDPQGTAGIGGHIHVATVKPRGGFQWVIPPIGSDGLPVPT